MAKDPAFLFYSSDFLTGTLIMSFEDRGKYITILAYMHQNGRLSEETIRLLVGNVSDNLRLKFGFDKNNLWFNERLEEEISKRSNFVDSRKENGKKGGRPTKKSIKEEKPTDNLPEDENEIENKDYNDLAIIKNIMEFFNFSETANYDKMRDAGTFVKLLIHQGEISKFLIQFEAYKKIKMKDPKFTHSFKNFIGTAKGAYLDGAWNAENWVSKLGTSIPKAKLNF